MNNRLLLPSVTSIRLTGRLNSSDRKLLEQNIYRRYAVGNVEELDMGGFPGWHSPYRGESAVLITLVNRGESLCAPRLFREEANRQDGMAGLGDREASERNRGEIRDLFRDLGLAIMGLDGSY
jgi:hypothetical protein